MKKGEVHLFQLNGKKMALDVESDTLHVLDDPAWEALMLLERGGDTGEVFSRLTSRYRREVVEGVIGEIEELADGGSLWSPPAGSPSPGDPVVKALCLNVAHACNLTCRYCFAGKGEYGGEKALMSAETGKAAVDFLAETAGERRHAEIDYFGGEPLLNFPAIKEITSYARKKGEERGLQFRFTLTTNGLLLDRETREYLEREGFSVVLSLDGRPEVHNRMRSFPGGGESYDAVLHRLRQFVRGWKGGYYLRGTFTGFNPDFYHDVVHLYRQGFRCISLEPAVSSPHENWALEESHLPRLLEQYQKLADFYLERALHGDPFYFFHFEVDLEGGPCLYKRLSGCGAGDEYLAVTPGGELYPCHQLVGKPGFVMGNVHRPGDISYPLPEERFPPSGPRRGPCRACWARYHCGGGCRAAALLVNGDPSLPYRLECALQKKRLECSLYIKAVLKEREEEVGRGPVHPQPGRED